MQCFCCSQVVSDLGVLLSHSSKSGISQNELTHEGIFPNFGRMGLKKKWPLSYQTFNAGDREWGQGKTCCALM